MSIRWLTRVSMIAGLLGLGLMMVISYQSWQSLRSDVAEVERLTQIENRAAELNLAMNHLLLVRSSPSLVTGVRDEISQLVELLEGVDHPAARPARLHLREIEQILLAVPSAENAARDDQDVQRAINVAATQIGIHEGGLASALITILSDRHESINRSLTVTMMSLVLVAVTIVGLALLGFFVLHRRIGRPVAVLGRAIDAMRQGDLDTRVETAGTDELAQLGQSFNRMAEIRQQHEREIEQYQQDLQHSVERLRNIAYYDQLTGYWSREGFIRQLDQKLAPADGTADGYVLAFNINGMRDINETHGYAQGDRLFREIGRRMSEWLGEDSLVARVGGDEFAAFRRADAASRDDLDEIARGLIEQFETPFELPAGRLHVDIHFGIAPVGRSDATQALRQAEIALFAARHGSRRQWRAFTPDMERETHERLRMTENLRDALAREQLLLHYQPQVALDTGRLSGCEALLRWHHPRFGIQSPNQFIPVAEQSKLIVPIGEWVLRESCRQIVDWDEAGLPPAQVAVNVSLVQLLTTDFGATVRQVLDETGADPSRLSLEITENIFDRRSRRMLGMIDDLRALGAAVTLDDFGTGYSSLRYLREYQFSAIKLDLSFVQRITDDAYSRAICEMVIRIGTELDTPVIAEGIETQAQLEALRDLGCRHGQGYLFSHPLEPERFRQLLEDDTALPIDAKAQRRN